MRQLGLILAMAVSASLFTALLGAMTVLRSGANPPFALPDPTAQMILAGLMVVVLAIGSFMLETACRCLRRRGLIGLRATLLNTAAKGLAWLLLIALQFYLLAEDGFIPSRSTLAALYYLTFGLFAVHVMAAMALVVPLAVRSALPEEGRLRNATLYWHYLTALSVVLTVSFHL